MDTIQFEETRRDYFTMIPHIVWELGLTPNEFTLYARLRRRAGESIDGVSFEATGGLAKACGMSPASVSRAKRGLVAKGLIRIEKKIRWHGEWPGDNVTIVDIWAQNHAYFAQGDQNLALTGFPQKQVAFTSDMEEEPYQEEPSTGGSDEPPSRLEPSLQMQEQSGSNDNQPNILLEKENIEDQGTQSGPHEGASVGGDDLSTLARLTIKRYPAKFRPWLEVFGREYPEWTIPPYTNATNGECAKWCMALNEIIEGAGENGTMALQLAVDTAKRPVRGWVKPTAVTSPMSFTHEIWYVTNQIERALNKDRWADFYVNADGVVRPKQYVKEYGKIVCLEPGGYPDFHFDFGGSTDKTEEQINLQAEMAEGSIR